MASKYKTHSKSNLQGILVEYGMPEENKYAIKKVKREKKPPKIIRERGNHSTWTDHDPDKNEIKQEV